ncbi:hypothetical protein MKX01_022988 [Papaver californicum]|nr:hypothetical protein MKX01_022988 [Papaver californicum]
MHILYSVNGSLKVVNWLRNFFKKSKMVEEDNILVFVLIDEVESLAAARNAALSGSKPSDSIRVGNALLTQRDKLKSSPNVIILTTSNITAAIGARYVDFVSYFWSNYIRKQDRWVVEPIYSAQVSSLSLTCMIHVTHMLIPFFNLCHLHTS